MKKILFCLCLCISVVYTPLATAQSASLLITGVQTESATSATDEYIAITNSSLVAIDLSTTSIQYYAASVSDFTKKPTRTIVLNGTIQPKQTLYARSTAAANKEPVSWQYSATLAGPGGHIRLVSGTTEQEVHDTFGWGTAVAAEAQAAGVVEKGKSYIRNSVNDVYVDTNNNKNDFDGTPETVLPVVAMPPTAQESVKSISGIAITELMPDPASPLTDANDEYIELYNSSNVAVQLAGATLQTGTTFSHSYTFESIILAPQSYITLPITQTKLSLSNSGGAARLIDQTGELVYETATYEKAQTGMSWTLINDLWQWAEPSPNGAGQPVPEEVASATNAATTSKTTAPKASKATTTKKAAATSATKAAAATANTAYVAPESDNKKSPVNPLILAGIGVFALGYIVYEYRHDIFFRFKQSKRHSSASG